MNERIKILLESCINKEMTDKPWPLVDNEKFAELLIKECVYAIELVKQYRYDRYDPLATQKAIVEECQYQIKQYFGVE